MIYTARWVPITRFLVAYAEDLRARGLAVDLVDVDLDGEDADSVGVAVLPTFVFCGPEGAITHVGAISLAALAAVCGVASDGGASPRRRRRANGR